MERILSLDLWKAKLWYNSGDNSLKKIALSLFDERELLGEQAYEEKKRRERAYIEKCEREEFERMMSQPRESDDFYDI